MSNESSRTVSLNRIFNAPIALVWEAWTHPEHIAQWWSPAGTETKIIAHDFRVGGNWKYAMPMPNGQEFIAEGVYLEIVEFKKIVSGASFRPMTEDVEIQALFEDLGDTTGFTFNVVHKTVEYCMQQEKMGIMNGWGSVFTRLEGFLKSRK
jgi:uncharacterized protein YndB with AHSA1/START domain